MESELTEALRNTGLNLADWLILAFIVVLSVISLFKGFIKEAMSLVRLAAAVMIGYLFAGEVSALFRDSIKNPEFAYAIAYFALFIATMIVGTIISSLMKGIITAVGLGPIDKILGAMFGAIKGTMLVVLLTTLVNLTPLNNHELWTDSALVPEFIQIAAWSQKNLNLENVL